MPTEENSEPEENPTKQDSLIETPKVQTSPLKATKETASNAKSERGNDTPRELDLFGESDFDLDNLQKSEYFYNNTGISLGATKLMMTGLGLGTIEKSKLLTESQQKIPQPPTVDPEDPDAVFENDDFDLDSLDDSNYMFKNTGIELKQGLVELIGKIRNTVNVSTLPITDKQAFKEGLAQELPGAD